MLIAFTLIALIRELETFALPTMTSIPTCVGPFPAPVRSHTHTVCGFVRHSAYGMLDVRVVIPGARLFRAPCRAGLALQGTARNRYESSYPR